MLDLAKPNRMLRCGARLAAAKPHLFMNPEPQFEGVGARLLVETRSATPGIIAFAAVVGAMLLGLRGSSPCEVATIPCNEQRHHIEVADSEFGVAPADRETAIWPVSENRPNNTI